MHLVSLWWTCDTKVVFAAHGASTRLDTRGHTLDQGHMVFGSRTLLLPLRQSWLEKDDAVTCKLIFLLPL